MDYLSILPVVVVLIIFLLLFPELRWYLYRGVIGRANLSIDELPILFGRGRGFAIEHNKSKPILHIWQINVRVSNEQMSIIYLASGSTDEMIESVDISHIHRTGMVLTFHNQKLVALERVGGSIQEVPLLTEKQEKCLNYFMHSLRRYISRT